MTHYQILYLLRTEQRKHDPFGQPLVTSKIQFLPYKSPEGTPLTVSGYTPAAAFEKAKARFPSQHIVIAPVPHGD